MKHFIVYSTASGAVLRSGVCPDDDLAKQARAEQGEAVIEASADTIIVAEVNLAPVRALLHSRIDAEAEVTRLQFITPGAGQMMSYLQKREEAAAWAADQNAQVPVIAAEAQALGKTVATVVGEVQAAAALWIAGEALINATRLAAKKAVDQAENLAEMSAAAQVDWAALAASIQQS